MPLIPALPTIQKELLSLRLDRAIHERLKLYAAFIHSPKDYIIGQALRRLFEKDHEFAKWLREHDHGSVDTNAASR
jgi:predicted transcriptional regulator